MSQLFGWHKILETFLATPKGPLLGKLSKSSRGGGCTFLGWGRNQSHNFFLGGAVHFAEVQKIFWCLQARFGVPEFSAKVCDFAKF